MKKNYSYKIRYLTFGILIVILILLIVAHNNLRLGDIDLLAFVGAIIGGLITLFGVQYSIQASFEALELSLKKQEDDKFLERIEVKLNRLYKVKDIIFTADRMLSNKKFGWNKNYEKAEVEEINRGLITYFLPQLNILLEISSSVDYEFFNEIKKFVDDTRSYFFDFSEEDFFKITNSIDQLTKKIEDHESRICNIYEEISKKTR
ncbi:hypothetical protein [Ectobacillus polymachus]|uniref:hypothetical protein n=1 Tax=Ectobacillus polymachus TaxID=1508806 RepID=UPI003A839EC6